MSRRKTQTRENIGLFVVALVWLLPGMAWAEDSPPGETRPHGDGLIVEGAMDRPNVPDPLESPPGARSTEAITTRFRVPLRAQDWYAWTAYVDLDATSGFFDFDCQAESYDGHNANDLAIRDFVEQAEGRFVLAAAPGTVYATDDGYFDQETGGGAPGPTNVVAVDHPDGSRTQYLHLKKWSVMVYAGQQVYEGQPLAMVGSSGASNGPHLHFIIQQDGTNYEPQDGPCRPGDLLWQEPQPHYSNRPTDLAHTVLSAMSPLGGLYKFSPPDMHHFTQTPSTTQYYSARFRYPKPGDTSQIRIYDPSHALYHQQDYTFTNLYGYVHYYAYWNLPPSGSLGIWTLEHRVNGDLVAEKTFSYDAGPDFLPQAQGRTVTVAHGTAGDTLQGSDLDGGIKEFRLVSPPANGTVVLDGPRQSYFHYTPDSGFQGQDSFEFEVLDALDQPSPAATMTLDVSPVEANTLHLEGEDDHVAVPDNGSLDLTDGFTLEAWVRRTTGSAWTETLVDRRSGGSNTTGYSFKIHYLGWVRLQVGNGTSAVFADGTTPIPLDRWTHLAATWDGQELQVWVDGRPDGDPVPFSGPIVFSGTYDTMLGRSYAAGNSFRGEIDELRIWNESRASRLAQDPCELLAAPPPTLVGWWRFQGDALDGSGHGNHGSLVDAATFRSEEPALVLCSAEDTDGDGHDDAADNCPLAANSSQDDTDGDGFGDACDLCPAVFETRRLDFDRDGVGDACDLCPYLADTDQLDGDSDGSGDLCDPEPTDAGAGVPVGPIDLTLGEEVGTGSTLLSWNSDPVAETYQVIRGSRQEIRDRFYGTCVSGADPDPTDTTFTDGDDPPPGEMFGYLIVGVGAGGVQGLGGFDSSGVWRDMRAKDCL